MNNLILNLKKCPKYFSFPFILAASFLFVINVLNIFNFDTFRQIYSVSNEFLEFVFGTVAVFFISYYKSSSGKAGIITAFGYLTCDIVYYSATDSHFSLLFAVLFGFFMSIIADVFDLIYACFIIVFLSVLFAVLIGFCYDYLMSVLRWFCASGVNKSWLFGVINNIYSVLFGNNYNDLMLNKDYSLSILIDNQLVVGAKNAFLFNTKNPVSAISVYMSGKYLVNIFITIGAFVSLYKKLEFNELSAFTLVSIVAIIFGDVKLLSLFILLYNPIIYLGYLFMIFVAYFVCNMLDIRIGYQFNGSIIELFKYGQKWIYFILCGAIIAVMTYFVFKIILSKYDLSQNKILPKEVKKLIASLGGEDNIEKVTDISVIVKNPNLINVLKLDCDIKENIVTLYYDELELLKQYMI